MTRSIRVRRGRVALAGAAVATALLVSGCGAGQIAETADANPGVPGVNAQTPDGLFKVRNLSLAYPGPQGYPAGGDARLLLALYNDSNDPVTVEIGTTDARAVVLGAEPTAAPSPTEPTEETTTPDPSGSPTAPADGASVSPTDPAGSPGSIVTSAPPTGPARLEVPAAGFVLLNGQAGAQVLRLVGLGRALVPGEAVNLVFDFGGQRLEAPARVAVPLTPVPHSETTGPGGAGHG